jgi:hypothetical protein
MVQTGRAQSSWYCVYLKNSTAKDSKNIELQEKFETEPVSGKNRGLKVFFVLSLSNEIL